MLSAAAAGGAAEHRTPVAGRHCVPGAEAAAVQRRRGHTARSGTGPLQPDSALGDPAQAEGRGPTRRAPGHRDC